MDSKSQNPFVGELPLQEWLAVLEKQVALFSDKEINFLIQNGFECSQDPVLDLGCGAGFFVEKLQKQFPKGKFIAADQNKTLIHAFSRRQNDTKAKQVPTYVWEVGAGLCPIPNMEEVASVILRLVLQHVANPAVFLETLKKQLSPGTKIYIIEEDDSFFKTDPKFPALERVLKAWKNYGEKHQNHRFIGRTLAKTLADTGYKVHSVNVISQSHFEVGLEPLLSYFQITAEMIKKSSPELISAEDMAQIKTGFQEFIEKHSKDCFVFYPEIIVVAESL